MEEKKNQNLTSNIISAVCTLFLIAVIVILALMTTRSSDDFYYESFTVNGFNAFVEQMKEHYLTYNGRTVVHIIDALILHFGNICFAAVCAGCQILLSVSIHKLFDVPFRGCVPALCAGILLVPTSMFVQGYMWISAFCNYVIPAVLIICETALVKGCIGGTKHRLPKAAGLILFCLLCGALHEQAGIVSCVICASFVIVYLTNDLSNSLTPVLCTLAGIGGVLSVILSPSTSERMERSIKGTLTERLLSGAEAQCSMIKEYSIFAALIALCAVLTLIRQFGKKYTRLACIFNLIVTTGLILGMYFSDGGKAAIYYIILLIDLAAFGLILAVNEHPGYSLLIAAACSNAVMLATGFTESRTILPSVIYLIAAFGGLVGSMCGSKSKLIKALPSVISIILTVCALMYILPQIPGYKGNYDIYRKECESIKTAPETKKVSLYLDYDYKYTHKGKAFEDGFFYAGYLNTIKQKENKYTVYFYGEKTMPLYIRGELQPIPALIDDSGSIYLPYYEVLGGLGDQVYYDEEQQRSIAVVGSKSYYFDMVEITATVTNISDPEESYVAYAYPDFWTIELGMAIFKDFWEIDCRLGFNENGVQSVYIGGK